MNKHEKTTALDPAAVTDGEQSPTKSVINSIPESPQKSNLLMLAKEARLPDTNTLHTVSMNELYDTVYTPQLPLVENFLYTGTHLFVGAPKVGKSFFMAQLGYHVSRGLPLWVGYGVRQGTVLYLALEDTHARLQTRLFRMYGVEGSDNLHIAVAAKLLNVGLEKQLEQFVKEHPDCRLIIIDTLQRIRESGADHFNYANDYEVVTQLKRFGDSFSVCILVVHHTRKQDASDAFELISGTNGLLGAADGAFIMRKEIRTSNEATLDIVGRDQPDQRLHLHFERESCIWQLVRAENELWKEPPNPLLESVAALLTDGNPAWTGSATELAALLQTALQPNVLTRQLNVEVGRLLRDYGIVYESRRTSNERLLTFRKV